MPSRLKIPVVRLACISDTHMAHESVDIRPCDVLVHAGDCTRKGTRGELATFVAWLGAQPARHKLFIAGNHDHACEVDPRGTRALAEQHGVVYLDDEGVELDGMRFWGSPVTPAFRSLAFNRERGDAIRAHWAKIPRDVDVLVTHGPPRGLGDRMVLGPHVGCDDLLARVLELAPALHLFGHIHESAGEYRHPRVATRFVNAASCRLLLRSTRPAVTLEIG